MVVTVVVVLAVVVLAVVVLAVVVAADVVVLVVTGSSRVQFIMKELLVTIYLLKTYHTLLDELRFHQYQLHLEKKVQMISRR